MKVYGLSGKSGTGKSYQAMNLCRDRDIESIIDDGLFIFRNEIIAGRSAKRSETKIGAIKTALFTEDKHCMEVRAAIRKMKPASILVLGTSDRMVGRIAARLELPQIEEMIRIEDITTAGEREIARKQRNQQGKHVVPVPSFQLKRQFSGYFLHPIRMIRGWGFGRDDIEEKTVVRPTYSYLGNFIISDRVINDIVEQTAERIDGIVHLSRTISRNQHGELHILIMVTLDMSYNAIELAVQLQRQCMKMIEEMTAFNIRSVDVEVQNLE